MNALLRDAGVIALFLQSSAPAAAATLSGEVNSAGKPVRGAMITLSSADTLFSETVFTDAAGHYRLATIQNGPLSLRARARLTADETLQVNLAAGNAKVSQAITLRPLTTPQEISDSLPASAHFARIQFPKIEQKQLFQMDCTECHQTGAPATRQVRSLEAWKALIPSMTRGAEYTSDVHDAEYAEVMFRTFNGTPTEDKQTKTVDEEALSARITEWKLPSAQAAHDMEIYPPNGRIFTIDMYVDNIYVTDLQTNKTTTMPVPALGIPVGGTFAGQKDLPLYVKNLRHGIHSLTLGPDGKYYMTGSIGGDILVFDPVTYHFDAYPIGHGAVVPHTPRFDANGILWFTIYVSNQVGRFDPKTHHLTVINLPKTASRKEIVERPPAVYGLDISPIDGSIWYTRLYANMIGRIDPVTYQVQEWSPPVFGPRRARFDKDGGFWVPGYGDGKLTRFDTKTFKFDTLKIPTLGPGESEAPYAIAIDPKSQDLWVSTNMSDRMMRYTPKTKKWVSFPMPTRGAITRDVVITSDGRVCGASNPWGVPSGGLVEGNMDSIICLSPNAGKPET